MSDIIGLGGSGGLTGSFSTEQFERDWLGNGVGYAEEEVRFGADRDAASSNRSVDGTGQVCARGLPRSWDIAVELRDELLNCEIFSSLKEAQIVIEQ